LHQAIRFCGPALLGDYERKQRERLGVEGIEPDALAREAFRCRLIAAG
jgi:hypothetical protein